MATGSQVGSWEWLTCVKWTFKQPVVPGDLETQVESSVRLGKPAHCRWSGGVTAAYVVTMATLRVAARVK